MRRINSLKEIQNIELSILKAVVAVCNKYHLRYFLAGGTLLGAIRHQGFIPWDNDVDIAMPRPDYDKIKLIASQNNYLFNDRYKLLHITKDNDYCYPFIKLIDTQTILNEENTPIMEYGVYIDIFPLDGFGNDYTEAVNIQKEVARHASWAATVSRPLKEANTKLIRFIGKKLYFSIKNREDYFVKAEDKLRVLDFDKSQYVGSTYGLRGKKEIMNRKYYSDFVLADFCDQKFRVPIGYDFYLKSMYGDYMKLPPESQRIEPHSSIAYWKN